MEVNGEKLVDWVIRPIEGEPVDDVHCQKCRVCERTGGRRQGLCASLPHFSLGARLRGFDSHATL
jgi:hypothetical protein